MAVLPKIVALETTNTCNARCPFCPLFQGDAQMDRRSRHATIMDQALFQACVSEIVSWETKPDTIYLNMNGEPLSDPYFAGRLLALRKAGLGPIVDLQTNGQYLSEAIGRAILEAGIRRLTLGFDGATPETYAAHRVRCDYYRVLANLKQFARLRDEGGYRTRIAIQFVRTLMNEREVLAAYSLFDEILDPDLDIFQDTLAKDWGDTAAKSNIYYLSKRTSSTPSGCQLFETQLIVLADGVMAACCWDYNLGVSGGGFGTIKGRDMLKIWRGQKRQSVLERMRSPQLADKPQKCRTCISLFGGEQIERELSKLSDDRVYMSPSGFSYRFTRKTRTDRQT